MEHVREKLLPLLKSGSEMTDADRELMTLYSDSILPYEPAIYAADIMADQRKESILALSRSLDVVETVIRGPMLTGRWPSLADVQFFPSMCLFHLTLPVHVSREIILQL